MDGRTSGTHPPNLRLILQSRATTQPPQASSPGVGRGWSQFAPWPAAGVEWRGQSGCCAAALLVALSANPGTELCK